MRRLFALMLLVAACDPAAEDKSTDDTDTTGDTDASDMPMIDVSQIACDAAAADGMAITAGADTDSAPAVMIGMGHAITLPAEGSGWVKLDNDTHRDVTFFFDRDDSAIQYTDLNEDMLLTVGDTEDTCTDVSMSVAGHIHPGTWYVEFTGDGGDVWMFVTDASSGMDDHDHDHDDDDDDHEGHDH
jgi:hypothetical protein